MLFFLFNALFQISGYRLLSNCVKLRLNQMHFLILKRRKYWAQNETTIKEKKKKCYYLSWLRADVFPSRSSLFVRNQLHTRIHSHQSSLFLFFVCTFRSIFFFLYFRLSFLSCSSVGFFLLISGALQCRDTQCTCTTLRCTAFRMMLNEIYI